MTLGDDTYDKPLILKKIFMLYDRYVGGESLSSQKWSPRIMMTKYKDKPYTYELQPEYVARNKKFPCVKAMDWTEKTATTHST